MIFKKVLEYFPTPKFLDIPYAGLSISDSAIHCIQFGRKNNQLYIEKYSEKSIAPGVIVSGQINNKEELVGVLKTLKKELNLNFIKASLPEEKAYLFTSKVPIIKPEEAQSVIESKIEENVPVPAGELIFDYKLRAHNKEHVDVVVSALPIDLVETYVDIFSESGLSLLSLEIESQAVALSVLKAGDESTALIVNFGSEKVGLYVVNNRIVNFTSTIQTARDLPQNPDFLLQEIKKLFVYWHTLKENINRPEKKIEHIIVCGVKFNEEILSYLAADNATGVAFGNVWINVFDINNTVPEISFFDSLGYATAIGLALPDSILIQDSN